MNAKEPLGAHGVIAVTLQNNTNLGWMASQNVSEDILAALAAANYEVRPKERP